MKTAKMMNDRTLSRNKVVSLFAVHFKKTTCNSGVGHVASLMRYCHNLSPVTYS